MFVICIYTDFEPSFCLAALQVLQVYHRTYHLPLLGYYRNASLTVQGALPCIAFV